LEKLPFRMFLQDLSQKCFENRLLQERGLTQET
jgi:hypothetical protein